MEFGIKCPYCGIEQYHMVEGFGASEILKCIAIVGDFPDDEDKGCGKEFVIRWKLEASLTVHAIDDEDKQKQAAHGGDQS